MFVIGQTIIIINFIHCSLIGNLSTGGTRIRQAVPGAHEGPIFSIINLSDGGFLSGGGKDKKIHSWNSSFENQGTADVSKSRVLQEIA